jgi:hypothetical protein
MKDKKKRSLYEAPRSVALSASSANGQTNDPLGQCSNGSLPSTVTCTAGNNPSQLPGACSPTGLNPSYGNCNAGGNVVNICSMGSFVTT